MTDHYAIHDLVTLRSNVDLPVPDYFATDAVDDPNIIVSQEPLTGVDVPRNQKKQRADYAVWRHDGALVIDYEVFDIKLLIGNLDGTAEIRFTERFADRRMKHVKTLARLAVQLKLLEQGYTFVHAGCVAFDDRAVLVPAMGSTGKTYTTLSLVDGEQQLLMADDLAIVGEAGDVYAYPGAIGTGPYVLENEAVPEFSVRPTLSSRLAEIPLVSLIFGMYPRLYKSKSIEPPPAVIRDHAHASALFMITGGTADDAAPIPIDEAVRRSLLQHFDTHNLFANFGLNYYSYFFDYDLAARIGEMREVLTKGLSAADCYELRANDLDRYPELVRQTLARS
jgi:hypothetical protein